MKLLTKELVSQIPALYGSERFPNEHKLAYAKLIHPLSSWIWYVLEFDGSDECFGIIVGFTVRFSYFHLSELESVRLSGIGIERDCSFKPTMLKQLGLSDLQPRD